MPADVGSVELYMGPHDLNNKDNLEQTIVDFISEAKTSLDIAVQELESEEIAKAILKARADGVRVRVVIERKYVTVDTPVADPWSSSGENEDNRRIYNALLRAKIDVYTDMNPETFHQKFIVRDPEDSYRAAVLTGSTNFTPTGTHNNLNHLVIVKGKRTAGVYEDEFEEIFSGTFGRKAERHDPKPKTYQVSGIPVKVLFAPDHAPEMEIMKQMLKGRERIDFAMFTFAQSSGIDDTLIALQKSGIAVRGVLDRRQANQDWAATRPLASAGVELHTIVPGGGLSKLHHKLAVIDGQVLIVGSFNFTNPANALNDENIMVIGDLQEKDPESIARQKQLAQYALDEIDRIIAETSEPLQ